MIDTPVEFPKTGNDSVIDDPSDGSTACQQGPATPVSLNDDETIVDALEFYRDVGGYTHPNLHRRILTKESRDSALPKTESNDYILMIIGNDSYRTTTTHLHQEAEGGQGENEIP